ncbi:MAG: hypothetical protein KDC27_06240, partial [Acidobacteria bacterium]|nr:hypothetical protein [Acidobacteriota bacterium]
PLWRLTPVAVSGPIPYFIDEPAVAGRPHDRWLAERALQAWDHALEGWLCMTPAKATDAAIRIYWGMTGDRLGLMQAIEAGPYRGAEVYVDPQPQAFDPQLAELCRRDPLFRDAIVYITLLHETGHALGLDHTINMADAMYFGGDYVGFYKAYRAQIESLDDIRRRPGLSEEDLLRVRAQYPPEALLQQHLEELARKQAASK